MRYGATTRLSPERALEKAQEYFGKLELALQERSDRHALFSNVAGHVLVTVTAENGTELDIETIGYDSQVKTFLQRIG
ncbi:MAG TPA: hypothetical protein PLQ92_02040 [Methanomassiliicoccales archaeon]|nr:hypothetical protein [Methanomassiliicoccales archaeon]